MTERIITDSNGRKHITNEPLLHKPAPGSAHYEDGDVFERIAARKAQPAQQEPLTDDEILAANYPDGEENGPTIAAPDFELICFARQIEAKLREKNGITKEQT